MRTFALFLLFICTNGAGFAQRTVVYPEAAALRTSLERLLAERQSGFQQSIGALSHTRGSTNYYFSSLHFVPKDTPLVCVDQKEMKCYFLDFFAKGMTEPDSKTVFAKWQDLVQSALPGYAKQQLSNQYPDLESWDYVGPGGKISLYRNGTGNECQVSITLHASNMPVVAPTVATTNNTVSNGAAKKQLAIDEAVFGTQLTALLGHSKTGFKSIIGPEKKSAVLPTNYSTLKLSGAETSVVINAITAMTFIAYYPDQSAVDSKASFRKISELVARKAGSGFVRLPLEEEDGDSTVRFENKKTQQVIEVIESATGGTGKRNVRVQVKKTLL